MPWPMGHKRETRDRIVEAAAAEFRARGVSGVGVADVMARAGLTHGGFYAHFSSKEDLLAEALSRASEQARERLAGGADALPPGQRLAAIVDRYLSPEHAAHPDRGCPLAALGPELVRADVKTRRRLAQGIRSRLDLLGREEQASRAVSEAEAAGVLACMVGGLVLARGLGGSDGDALLRSCRAFLRQALTRHTRPCGTRERAGGRPRPVRRPAGAPSGAHRRRG